ncbi:MAG: hypothetical protein J6W27_01055 [Alphaproteobacteria bacterium]|nr:hypothetical protein [Alphaproteobacteria bacterium]
MRTLFILIFIIACVFGILYLMSGDLDNTELLDKLFNATSGIGEKILNVFTMPASSLKIK